MGAKMRAALHAALHFAEQFGNCGANAKGLPHWEAPLILVPAAGIELATP